MIISQRVLIIERRILSGMIVGGWWILLSANNEFKKDLLSIANSVLSLV